MEEIPQSLEKLLTCNRVEQKSEQKQIATLLTVIKEEAREVFSTFTSWEREGDKVKIVRTCTSQICGILSPTEKQTLQEISLQPSNEATW